MSVAVLAWHCALMRAHAACAVPVALIPGPRPRGAIRIPASAHPVGARVADMHYLIPTLGVQSASDQRAGSAARSCHPSVWSGACGAVPIHGSARARQRPQHSLASAGSAPQRPLLLLSPSGSGAGVRARRRWSHRRHPGSPTVRRAIGAAPAPALRSAPAASCALRQRWRGCPIRDYLSKVGITWNRGRKSMVRTMAHILESR